MARCRAGDSFVAVAYLRVSTEDQALGPEAQRAAISTWASSAGVTVAAWHEDRGVSGALDLDARPGLVAALGALRGLRAGVLVVAKRDRLARDVAVAAAVDRAVAGAGGRVVSADGVANGDQPADAFLRTILDGAAAYERALIRARTKAALAVKRARGEYTGGEAPYGWRVVVGGTLEPHPEERLVICRARELRAEGLTVRAVTAALRAEGVVGRRGRPLAPSAVHLLFVPDLCSVGSLHPPPRPWNL